ncbi:MAG: four helix bundle protein [Patescibacteria group bacterium]
MKIQKFEDIISWQKAKELNILLNKQFQVCRDFNFKTQLLRAAVSIMNNIAEGYERGSNKELKHFLFISKGSCAEVRSMLYLALELGFITQEQFDFNSALAIEISKMISGFIKTL